MDFVERLKQTLGLTTEKPKRGTNAQGAREINTLAWDTESLRITNNTEANALLTKTYRPGWEVPAA